VFSSLLRTILLQMFVLYFQDKSDVEQVFKAKAWIKDQEKAQKSYFWCKIIALVPLIALTVRPCHYNRAQQMRTTPTDRADMTHDRASSQFPLLAVFTSGTVVCLLGTTVRPSQCNFGVTNSWFLAIKAL